MPEFTTADGRYLFVEQGDKNAVVYDLHQTPVRAVFDRWSYEAGVGPRPLPPVPIAPPLPIGEPRVFRVTDPTDGEFVPRMYSYWANALVQPFGTVIVFAGHADGLPRFFSVDLRTGAVQRLGSLVPYTGTTEGWYWMASGHVMLLDGPRLRRVNPFDPNDDLVIFDISATAPGCRLWQAHSSDDGRTHSATVQRVVDDGPWPKESTVVSRDGTLTYFPRQGVLDESQVSRDGRWLVIKEDDDNRFIDLDTGAEQVLEDAAGALGHSDLGHGFAVGEDNIIGACVWMNLADPRDRRVLFGTWNMGYVSTRGGRCLHSDATHLNLVALTDPFGKRPLIAHGNQGTDYDDRVKANLDPTGRVACYMSNVEGRRDVYLVQL